MRQLELEITLRDFESNFRIETDPSVDKMSPHPSVKHFDVEVLLVPLVDPLLPGHDAAHRLLRDVHAQELQDPLELLLRVDAEVVVENHESVLGRESVEPGQVHLLPLGAFAHHEAVPVLAVVPAVLLDGGVAHVTPRPAVELGLHQKKRSKVKIYLLICILRKAITGIFFL